MWGLRIYFKVKLLQEPQHIFIFFSCVCIVLLPFGTSSSITVAEAAGGERHEKNRKISAL